MGGVVHAPLSLAGVGVQHVHRAARPLPTMPAARRPPSSARDAQTRADTTNAAAQAPLGGRVARTSPKVGLSADSLASSTPPALLLAALAHLISTLSPSGFSWLILSLLGRMPMQSSSCKAWAAGRAPLSRRPGAPCVGSGTAALLARGVQLQGLHPVRSSQRLLHTPCPLRLPATPPAAAAAVLACGGVRAGNRHIPSHLGHPAPNPHLEQHVLLALNAKLGAGVLGVHHAIASLLGHAAGGAGRVSLGPARIECHAAGRRRAHGAMLASTAPHAVLVRIWLPDHINEPTLTVSASPRATMAPAVGRF